MSSVEQSPGAPLQATVCVGDARVLFGANAAFEGLTGFSAAELAAMPFDALLGPEREPAVSARLKRALEHHELFTGEVLWRRKSGEFFWNELVVVPMPATASAPRHLLVLCRDVTTRKAAQSVPGVRAAHDRTVLDAIEAGIVVHKATTEIIYANAKASEMLGITHDALLGVVNTDPRWRFLGEDLQPLTIEQFPMMRALTTRRVVRQVTIGVERPSDGKISWGMCNAHPILDDEGAVTEVVVSFTDVTELKQTELALQKSEERLRLVLQGSNDAPWDWDLVADQLYYAPRWWQMLGYEVGELGTDRGLWSRLMHPDDRPRVLSQLEQWVHGDATQYEIEFRLQAKSGQYVSVLSRGFIKRDAQGRAVRISGTNTDVTERRALEDKLRQSQKMEAVGQLAGGVAHDFNNLLSIVVGNLEMVKEHLDESPDAAEALRDALSASQRGAELTRRLLSFSRQQPLQVQVIDVGVVLKGLSGVLRRLISETIEIDVRISADLPRVAIDPALFENALLNLAINARDAMPSGGTLTLSAERSTGGGARLAVRDTGVGMSPEIRERALEPFFTTKPTGQGTGLGLSMVYGFVQQSGGSLQLLSAPGEGTTVLLEFPAAVGEVADTPTGPRAVSRPAERRDEVVLVVEDEPGVRRLCVQGLERLGFRTLSAGDGPEALEVLAAAPRVDLLLTDVVMPRGLSGPDVATAALKLRPQLKVLFMSGYLPSTFDPQTRARIQPLLSKPFSASELERQVSLALRERGEGRGEGP